MSTVDVSDPRRRIIHASRASTLWALITAGLFLGSAVLQLLASLQRWAASGSAQDLDEVSAEDHLFDYSFPTDPWENIGTAAQLFGAGTVVLALGVVVMAVAVWTLPRAVGPRHVVLEIVVAALVAASLGINGMHALASGVAGTPSPLQHVGALGLVGFVGLVTLAVLWRRRSGAAMAACLFLLGSSALGYLVAAFVIAPLFAGGLSHDTTPWTEAVVAATTAAAGVAMLVVARAASAKR